jgi:hypothetical protein
MGKSLTIAVMTMNDSMIYNALYQHYRRFRMAKEADLPGRAKFWHLALSGGLEELDSPQRWRHPISGINYLA